MPSCFKGPTLWTLYCLHPRVWWERPGVTHHPKHLVDLQKTAYLALSLQPPPETDVSVWPQWVEPASAWGCLTFLVGGVSALIDITEG